MRTRQAAIDTLLVAAVAILAAAAVFGLLAPGVSRFVPTAALVGLALLAVVMVAARFLSRRDHDRALQSQTILDIANETLSYLREGLTEKSAQEVCRIILADIHTAAAVAITDTERVLGFAGVGEDHHEVGGPILTRATNEVLASGRHEVLERREEIGCPDEDCLLKAAIVVPLEMRGAPAGTLKFYYTTSRLLNETQITMAEGLARLLSTQLELSELERQTELATQMELKALQAQINPHFLFNTINTIASLIRTDPPRARELLREFASFYRRTLETGDELIPLDQELEQTRRYIVFEQARFGDRVSYAEDVDEEIRRMLVPAFLIQPIVENAIQHGMRTSGVLHVCLEAKAEGERVALRVVDDGNGIAPEVLPRLLEPGFGNGLGIALKNVDDRLKGHFGPGSGLLVESTEGEGATVTLFLERRLAADSGDEPEQARIDRGA